MNSLTRHEKVTRGLLTGFFHYGLQITLQIFLTPLVLRTAGQETLGAYAILMQALAYLALVDLGFSVAMNRFIAQAYQCGDVGRSFKDVLSTSRTFLLFSNTVFALLVLLSSTEVGVIFGLSTTLDGQTRWGMVLLAVWAVLRTPLSVAGTALTATQNLAKANIARMVGSSCRLLLSLGLVVAGAGLVGLILANIIAEAISMLMSHYWFRRLFPDPTLNWSIPDRRLLSEMVSFGLKGFLVAISWRLVAGSDNLVVGYLLGAVATSIYLTTQLPTTIGYNVINLIVDNAAPAINEMQARGDRVWLRRKFLLLSRIVLFLGLLLGIGLLLLNRMLVLLWVGADQYAGDLMTIALAVFALLICLTHVNQTFLFAGGRITLYSFVTLIEGLMNLGLSLWLGRLLGLSGVMVATALCSFVTSGYSLWRITSDHDIPLSEYFVRAIWPMVLPVAFTLGIGWVLGRYLLPSSWLGFSLNAVSIVLLFALLVYLIGLNREERMSVASYFSGRVRMLLQA